MRGSIIILGCGSSGGVPRVGQGWGACDPNEPRNARLRCSILIERRDAQGQRTTILVDTSPDLRQQLLATDTPSLDSIILTHSHADHTHGIDDVRPLVLNMHRRIDLFMDDATARDVRGKFGYIFETPPGSYYPPLLNHRRIVAGQAFVLAGAGGPVEITGFDLEHGEIRALGLRFGDVAYTPDLNGIPEDSMPFLENLDLWIVDALRYTRHPSHFSLAETLHWISHFKPRHTVLTNLHCDLDYATLRGSLPPGIEPAYDGMTLAFGR